VYEAEKMMPKKEDTMKMVTDNNSFALYQDADAIANIGGKPYLATKQEDPDDEDDDEGLIVWRFDEPHDPTGAGFTTDFSDKAEAIKQFKEYLHARKSAQKLAKADSVDAIIQSILEQLGLSELSVDIIDSVTPELIRAFQTAGVSGIGQVGVTATSDITKHLDKAALAYAEAHAAELVTNLTATTTESLRGTISNAVKEGMSAQRLSDAIQTSGAFGEARANTIARTELAMAHVNGNVEGWKETGLVGGKESILGDLHDIDDECDECAAAGVVGINDDFIPGLSQPPYHPNCVCAVLPVLKEDM